MALSWSSFDKFLRGEALAGKKLIVTIAEMTLEEVHVPSAGTEVKPALWFREIKQGLILSPTNRHALIDLFGDDVTGCIDKQITLEAKPMRVAGRATLPVRISAAPAPSRGQKPDVRAQTLPPNGAAPEPAAHAVPPGQAPAATSEPAKSQTDSQAPGSADAEFGALPSEGERRQAEAAAQAAADAALMASALRPGVPAAAPAAAPAGPRYDYRNIARPWDTVTVLAYLEDVTAAATAKGTPANGKWGAAIGLIKRLAGEQDYRCFLHYVFKVGSSKDLTDGQRVAVGRWAGCEKAKDGTSESIPLAGWREEWDALLEDCRIFG
jgi:hypothetical protein